MKITIERTIYSETETRGEMKTGGRFIGYTLEPPTFGHTSQSTLFALPPGEYEVCFKNNPIAGVPCIKLWGITYSATASIRCCKPKGKANASIILLSKPDGTGEYSVVDIDAWVSLVSLVYQKSKVTLIIK